MTSASNTRSRRVALVVALAVVVLAAGVVAVLQGTHWARSGRRLSRPLVDQAMSADSVDRALRALTDRALALLPDSLRSEALLLRSKSEAAGADRLTEAELARLHELNTAALDLLSPAHRAEWNRIVGAVMRQYSSQEFPAGK